MNVFAISDLHLDGGGPKPMDVFGPQWTGHFRKISLDWRSRVGEDDLVLIPGDISWAMLLEDALTDLRKIGELPGRKVLLRGNHDYWWGGIGRLRAALPMGMYAVQNDAVRFGPVTVAGSRGWTLPGPGVSQDDERIYRRELTRIELSLAQAKAQGGRLIVMTHYPPVGEDGQPTEVSRLIAASGALYCVYGHLHGTSGRNAFRGTLGGTDYLCVSCDQTDFRLVELPLPETAVGDGNAAGMSPVADNAGKVEDDSQKTTDF